MGFKIGSLFFPYYGSLIVLGVLVAAGLGILQAALFKLDIYDFILLAAVAGLGGMIGAKVLYLLVSIRTIQFSQILNPSYLNSIMGGGFVFYGGLIGGMLSVVIFRRFYKLNILLYISRFVPCLPVAHGFGRLGCSAVGCCYGIPFDSMFSITYSGSPFAPNGIPLFPVQIAEAVGNFLIAGVLLFYIDVLKRDNGIIVYLLSYSFMRFFLEFLRSDEERGHLGMLSVSQWVSILLVLTTVAWYMYSKRPRYKA